MSLNGLDSDAVTQAYEAALGETGGWYVGMLQYMKQVTDHVLPGFY